MIFTNVICRSWKPDRLPGNKKLTNNNFGSCYKSICFAVHSSFVSNFKMVTVRENKLQKLKVGYLSPANGLFQVEHLKNSKFPNGTTNRFDREKKKLSRTWDPTRFGTRPTVSECASSVPEREGLSSKKKHGKRLYLNHDSGYGKVSDTSKQYKNPIDEVECFPEKKGHIKIPQRQKHLYTIHQDELATPGTQVSK